MSIDIFSNALREVDTSRCRYMPVARFAVNLAKPEELGDTRCLVFNLSADMFHAFERVAEALAPDRYSGVASIDLEAAAFLSVGFEKGTPDTSLMPLGVGNFKDVAERVERGVILRLSRESVMFVAGERQTKLSFPDLQNALLVAESMDEKATKAAITKFFGWKTKSKPVVKM